MGENVEKEFDIKKALKEKIAEEIKPILEKEGFVQFKQVSYVRERRGLRQHIRYDFPFGEMRTFICYTPIYYANFAPVVSTNYFKKAEVNPPAFTSIDLDVEDEKEGYRLASWQEDHGRAFFMNKVLPEFERLKESLVRDVLPELNRMTSLEQFMKEVRQKKPVLGFDKADPVDVPHLMKMWKARGAARMQEYIKVYADGERESDTPKKVYDYLVQLKGQSLTDQQADEAFEVYCNKIRAAYRLLKK